MALTAWLMAISTGMATREDIDDAVQAFREAGGRDLTPLHCTSAYPTLAEDVNLQKIPALAEAYGCLVGIQRPYRRKQLLLWAAVAWGA